MGEYKTWTPHLVLPNTSHKLKQQQQQQIIIIKLCQDGICTSYLRQTSC